MASEKDLGTRKKCFTCNQMMECRKTEHNGETKYQWQDGDGEQAHYKFDQSTQKPYCKNKSPEESKKGIDFENLGKEPKVDVNQIQLKYTDAIDNMNEEQTKRVDHIIVCVKNYINTVRFCQDIGIVQPQVIGMIYKQAMDRLK